MKLFHRMMMLTLILCLVFGLGGCTQENSPSEPEQSSMQTVEPPEEPGTEPLTFESADLGITFDLPDSLDIPRSWWGTGTPGNTGWTP